MATRRMFSKNIIESARFLRMPISSQALYFHLGIKADDDGVVEAYTVLRMTGATEDDLRVLSAKGLIVVLNEDLVTFITDWHEHNKIRPDRKIDSMYKDLLVQVLPDVDLIEKRRRADVKKMDDQWTDNGQPTDRIGKDRVGKDRVGKDNKDSRKSYDYDDIHMQLANKLLTYVKKNFSPKDTNLEAWANDIRLMMTQDGRTEEQISRVIDWSQNDSFWYANVRSAKKLREKYDEMYAQAHRQKAAKRNEPNKDWRDMRK